MRVGDSCEVEISGLGEGGVGRAELGELELLVPQLFPGEQARVRIDARARHRPRLHASVRELLRASPARRSPPCRHHDALPAGRCGGCPLMALEVPAQRAAKREWVARAYGLHLDGLHGGEEFGYRWSSKRMVGGRAGALRLGSRVATRDPRDRRRAAGLADMADCRVDHPGIAASFELLRREADARGIAPWRAGSHEAGALRYLWAKTNGERVLLTLISGGDEDDRAPLQALAEALVAADEGIAGVSWSVQTDGGNAIRGSRPQLLAGVSSLPLRLPGLDELAAHELGPLGFLQPNPTVAALAYAELVGPRPPRPQPGLARDLYAGAGVTTRLLRARVAEVVPCESYPESAAALGIAPQTVEVHLREHLASTRPRPHLIVANPPRAGLGAAVCEQLVTLAAPRLHLMSCSPASLAADLERLRPGYRLESLQGYDTLPQTAHLELVAKLRARPQLEVSTPDAAEPA